MKTIEYPIKEIVSFEMDENGIWLLWYDYKHECFPETTKEITDNFQFYDIYKN